MSIFCLWSVIFKLKIRLFWSPVLEFWVSEVIQINMKWIFRVDTVMWRRADRTSSKDFYIQQYSPPCSKNRFQKRCYKDFLLKIRYETVTHFFKFYSLIPPNINPNFPIWIPGMLQMPITIWSGWTAKPILLTSFYMTDVMIHPAIYSDQQQSNQGL